MIKHFNKIILGTFFFFLLSIQIAKADPNLKEIVVDLLILGVAILTFSITSLVVIYKINLNVIIKVILLAWVVYTILIFIYFQFSSKPDVYKVEPIDFRNDIFNMFTYLMYSPMSWLIVTLIIGVIACLNYTMRKNKIKLNK